ncbi:Yos1-like protein [Aspergillus venezuelensis]|uniref:YOS1 family protein n=1 Tax=Aspergillus stella-maris TaxID=1810926 RepID=UPI003CCD8949
MSFFGLGRLVYVIVLITNSIAILSEDRFLARIGWGRQQNDPSFGAAYDNTSVKAKTINLIASVRTVMRIPLIVINTIIIVYELILG